MYVKETQTELKGMVIFVALEWRVGFPEGGQICRARSIYSEISELKIQNSNRAIGYFIHMEFDIL